MRLNFEGNGRGARWLSPPSAKNSKLWFLETNRIQRITRESQIADAPNHTKPNQNQSNHRVVNQQSPLGRDNQRTPTSIFN